MSDDVVRLSVIGQLLRRRRRLLAVLAALGAVVGALAWLVLPASYAATSKVVVQGSSSEEGAPTEVQIAKSRVVVDRAVASLGWEPGTVARDAVSAEAGDGNVITITATAGSPSRARQLAERVTKAYMAFSTEIGTRAADAAAAALDGRREDLQRRVGELDQRIRGLSGSSATELDELRNRRTELLRALNEIEGQVAEARAEAAVGQSTIRVIEPPVEPTAPATPTLLQFLAGGVVLAPLLGAATLVGLRVADRRLRRRSDIASALGAPVLGTLQAPAEGRSTAPESGGWRARLRWLLGSGLPPPAPADRSLEILRCRRVLARLRGAPDGRLRLHVVAAEDDAPALRAVARLAVASVGGDRSVSVLTEDRRIAAAVEAETAACGLRLADIEVATGPTTDRARATYRARATDRERATVLRVQAVAAARPTIPSDSNMSGALVVVSSGTRTAWELVAVAEACRDAVLPIRGALVVVAPGEEETVEGEPLAAAPEHPVAAVGQLNGHASGVKA